MRFIATGDWQLGKAAVMFDGEARPRYQQARFDAVRRIVSLAHECGADFVVVCGDVFESNQLDRKVVSRTFEALKGATVPVILLPGNHDPLDALSIYDSDEFMSRKPPNVHVLRDSAPFQVSPTIQVVGAPWFSKQPTSDLVAAACVDLATTPPGTVRVLVGHGAVSTLAPDPTDPAIIDVSKLNEAIERGAVDVAVLGDRHGMFEVAPRIWYPGTPEVTDRREIYPGYALLMELDPGGDLRVEKKHVGVWKFLVVDAICSDTADVSRLLQRLEEIPQKSETAVWLSLEGELSTADFALLESGLSRMRDVFAYLEHWERYRDLVLIPDTADYEVLGLSGYAASAVSELVETSVGLGDDAAAARGALALLYRLAGGAQ